jgi:8-oxo-dGTP pyrophosphatase MutT (NUDIX family)
MQELLPDSVYAERLPKKVIASGMLFTNASKQILVVKPTYRDYWLIPGGMVDADEAPCAAAIREVREEIGLEIAPDRLLCVDWHFRGDRLPADLIHFVWYGGELSDKEIEQIRLPVGEIAECCFVSANLALAMLPKVLSRCIKVALMALEKGSLIYSENGETF